MRGVGDHEFLGSSGTVGAPPPVFAHCAPLQESLLSQLGHASRMLASEQQQCVQYVPQSWEGRSVWSVLGYVAALLAPCLHCCGHYLRCRAVLCVAFMPLRLRSQLDVAQDRVSEYAPRPHPHPHLCSYATSNSCPRWSSPHPCTPTHIVSRWQTPCLSCVRSDACCLLVRLLEESKTHEEHFSKTVVRCAEQVAAVEVRY